MLLQQNPAEEPVEASRWCQLVSEHVNQCLLSIWELPAGKNTHNYSLMHIFYWGFTSLKGLLLHIFFLKTVQAPEIQSRVAVFYSSGMTHVGKVLLAVTSFAIQTQHWSLEMGYRVGLIQCEWLLRCCATKHIIFVCKTKLPDLPFGFKRHI